jgi:hypothetical protein
LDQWIAPGDVLFVKGTGGLTEIGTTGGFLGHFLVVLEVPKRLAPTSWGAEALVSTKPHLDKSDLWRVQTLESTRSEQGLHRTEMLMQIDRKTGRFIFVGELCKGEFTVVDDEVVQLWQSPGLVRSQVQKEAVSEVCSEMKACEKNWSLATAARAVLMIATVQESDNSNGTLLEQLRQCWTEAPICTSVVVIFWQRLLCRMGPRLADKPLSTILKVMPLKADRGLPGDLIDAMSRSGWTACDHIPCRL